MTRLFEILEKSAIIAVLCFYVPSSQINEALLYLILISFAGVFAQGAIKALKEQK